MSKGFRRGVGVREIAGPGKLRQMTSATGLRADHGAGTGPRWLWRAILRAIFYCEKPVVRGGDFFPRSFIRIRRGPRLGLGMWSAARCRGPRSLKKVPCRKPGIGAGGAAARAGTSSRRESRELQAFRTEDGRGTFSVAAAHDSMAEGRKVKRGGLRLDKKVLQ